MGPACDLGYRPILVKMVVHDVRVSHEVAGVAAQDLVDGGAVVALRESIEDVLLRRDQHPEVAIFAAFRGQDQNARRIDAQVR